MRTALAVLVTVLVAAALVYGAYRVMVWIATRWPQ